MGLRVDNMCVFNLHRMIKFGLVKIIQLLVKYLNLGLEKINSTVLKKQLSNAYNIICIGICR